MSLEAFSRCLLDTIVIGPSVRHLPHFLFSDQKALKYVDFCARHVERMSSLFFECRSETVLHVASDVETIPNNIFFNFVGLKKILFDSDSRLRVVGDMSFANCCNLESLVLPSSLERVGEGAFSYCSPNNITFKGKRPPYLATTSFMGVDKMLQVFIPCYSLGLYARSTVGNFFPNLVYEEGCVSNGSDVEVIYINDTVYIHDTVYVPLSFFESTKDDLENEVENDVEIEEDEIDGEEGEPVDWIVIEGQQLTIMNAKTLRGVSVRVFDDKGILVLDKRIPRSQMSDNYKLKLPESQRYYLRLDMGKPYLIDVPAQVVKE